MKWTKYGKSKQQKQPPALRKRNVLSCNKCRTVRQEFGKEHFFCKKNKCIMMGGALRIRRISSNSIHERMNCFFFWFFGCWKLKLLENISKIAIVYSITLHSICLYSFLRISLSLCNCTNYLFKGIKVKLSFFSVESCT